MQESARKDIERAFGVLQARFNIVREPARSWSVAHLSNIMKTCIILHNMIVEDERDTYKRRVKIDDYDTSSYTVAPSHNRGDTAQNHVFISRLNEIRDSSTHIQLQNDLVQHLWEEHGNSN